jgi:hypothetical protein
MRKFVIPYSTKQRFAKYTFVIGGKYFVDNFTLHFSKPDIIRVPVESGNYIGTVGVSGMQYNSSTGKWEETYMFGGIGFTDQDTIGDILVDWKTRGFSETDKISIVFYNYPSNPCKYSVETTVLNTTTLLLSAARNIGEFSGGFRGTFEGSVNDWSWDDDSSQIQVNTNFYNNYYGTTGFGLGYCETDLSVQSALKWLPEDGRLILRSNRSTSDERGIIVSDYTPSDRDTNDYKGTGTYYTYNTPRGYYAKKAGDIYVSEVTYNGVRCYDSSYEAKLEHYRLRVGRIGATTDEIVYVNYNSVAKVESGYTTYAKFESGSDRRIKENIKDLDMELSLNLIDATETKSFKYIGAEGTHYGMIAQDARELLDNLGETDSQLEHSMGITDEEIEDRRAINYEEYIPHLINYVKELRAELNQVKAELRELKGE